MAPVVIKVAATVTLLPTSPPESCAVALATARMELSIAAPGFAARRRSRVSQQPRPHGLRPTLTSPPCCQALPTAPKTWTLSWRSMRASGCWHEQQQQQQDVAETGDTSLPHSRVAVAFTGVHIALKCCLAACRHSSSWWCLVCVVVQREGFGLTWKAAGGCCLVGTVHTHVFGLGRTGVGVSMGWVRICPCAC